MKTGIIVYSFSGNTLSVAQKLQDSLLSAGHLVTLEQVKALNDSTSATTNIQLQSAPDITEYDRIIFASPVRAFSLAPVMKTYLSQLPSLEGKQVDCFVTQFFPYPWMGGNRAISEMKQACSDKGAIVSDTGVVNWSGKKRERLIDDVLAKLGK
jgi:NAD(P)H-dependent FMN reductase